MEPVTNHPGNSVCYLLSLPSELIYNVLLSGLPLTDVTNVSLTSKKLKVLIDDDFFWKELFRQFAPVPQPKNQVVSWKDVFRCCFDAKPENIYARFLNFPIDPVEEVQSLKNKMTHLNHQRLEDYQKVLNCEKRLKELEILAQYPEPPFRINARIRECLAKKKKTFELIMALFGGRDAFFRFPKIKISTSEQFFVPLAYKIIHNISWAIDSKKRMTIYIKFIDTNGNQTNILVVQQIAFDSGDWCLVYNQNVREFIPFKKVIDHAHYNIGIFIQDGVIIDTIAFQNLKNLLNCLSNKFSYKSESQYKLI